MALTAEVGLIIAFVKVVQSYLKILKNSQKNNFIAAEPNSRPFIIFCLIMNDKDKFTYGNAAISGSGKSP
jgi:hypothetical protein